jgi:hypothetical protein
LIMWALERLSEKGEFEGVAPQDSFSTTSPK